MKDFRNISREKTTVSFPRLLILQCRTYEDARTWHDAEISENFILVVHLRIYMADSPSEERKNYHVLSSGKLHYRVAVTLYYSENYLPRGRHPESTPAVSHSVLVQSDMIKFFSQGRSIFALWSENSYQWTALEVLIRRSFHVPPVPNMNLF